MTHRTGNRLLEVGALARVEGEGALHVQITDDQVTAAQLQIYEPPRFFEAFLRGRHYTEPPDITARICGICPVAYQMSACLAIEDACGADVPADIAALRHLLYCGEWIESHALHIYLLHAPDFLGYDSAIAMAGEHRAVVQEALRLKKIGNALLETIGGRAVHPINVRVGGFYKAPDPAALASLEPQLQWALQASLDTVERVASFDFPDYDGDWDLVALAGSDDYPFMGRRIRAAADGLDIDVAEFPEHFTEEHVAHSTALHGRWAGGTYLVGPLARYAVNRSLLPPAADAAARAAGLGEICRNPFRSIVVRAVELVAACETALALVRGYRPLPEPFVEVPAAAGIGHGVSEAPRGLLYHRYEIDDDGLIVDATIVPPTAQNQPAIEHDLMHVVQDNLALNDHALTHRCEQTIRNYDPCISCATHFLRLEVHRS
jgi:sulfhydrogenase subunit alpha